MSNHIVWAHHCPVSHERLYSVLDHCPKCGVAQPVAAIPEFDSPAQTIDAQFDRYELWCEDHGTIATLTGDIDWFCYLVSDTEMY